MTTKAITTRTAKLWLRDDGIIQMVSQPQDREHLEDAQANIAVVAKLTEKPRPKLVDMRAVPGIDREARLYYSSAEAARLSTAVALLVESPVTQVMANFFIGFNKPLIPIRLFTSEVEAIVWLKSFIDE